MKSYKMIATDLDGTLLGSDLKVSEENLKAIKEISEKGIMIVVATGRTLCETEDVLKIPEIRYVIYSNGAAILDKKTGENILVGLDGEDLRFVYETVSTFDTFSIIHKNGKTYAHKEKALRTEYYRLPDAFVELVNNNCVLEDDYEKAFMDGAIESVVVFFAKEDEMEACGKILSANKSVQAVKTCATNFEILSADAGKGTALKSLAKRLNIEIEDVIAIGDGDNDRHMISVAGLGLATENGGEELKAIADRIICSNDEHIMKYVQGLIGEKI